MSRKGDVEIEAIILGILVIVISTTIALIMMLYMHQKETTDIEGLYLISEGDMYAESMLQSMLNSQYEGAGVRDILRTSNDVSLMREAILWSILDQLETVVITEYTDSVDLTGMRKEAETLGKKLLGELGEKIVSKIAEVGIDILGMATTELLKTKGDEYQVITSWGGVYLKVTCMHTEWPFQTYSVSIKSNSINEIMGDEEALRQSYLEGKAYVSREELLREDGEKLEIIFYVEKDTPQKTLIGKEGYEII